MLSPGVVSGSVGWLDIFAIALSQASEGKWYASTLELQLACFEACVACRDVRTLRVTVDSKMPLSLWDDHDFLNDCVKEPERRQLPPLRATAVAWKMPDGVPASVLSKAALLREVTWMQVTGVTCNHLDTKYTGLSHDSKLQPAPPMAFSPKRYFAAILGCFGEADLGSNTIQCLDSKSWPPALCQLSLGCLRGEHVDWAALPTSLKRLALGGYFNQPIEFASWPVSLVHLTLGGRFNQPIDEVLWPKQLLRLTFGKNFNQAITNVPWPSSLLQLTLGDDFDQPITDVVWPASLLKLRFGNDFNQEITNVKWPECLLGLIFGYHFDKPIVDVMWPDGLKRLEFGHDFNQPITDVIWSDALRSLVFGIGFDQPVQNVVWPASLRWLVLNDIIGVEQANSVEWPPTLELLIFRNPLLRDEGPGWPPVKDDFDNPLVMDLKDL